MMTKLGRGVFKSSSVIHPFKVNIGDKSQTSMQACIYTVKKGPMEVVSHPTLGFYTRVGGGEAL